MGWSWDTDIGGGSTPSWWAILSAARRGKVFYKGETVSLTLSQATATGYEVRDYLGNVVASGSVSGTTLNLGVFNTCGWYRLYLTRGTSASFWGTACGDATFLVVRTDTRFVTVPAWGTPGYVTGQQYPVDEALRGTLIIGPERYRIDLPDGVAAVGTYHRPGVQTLVTDITKSYYLKSDKQDAARPRKLIVSFPENANTTDIADEVTSVVSNLVTAHSDVEWWFEGPYNEPQGEGGAAIATKMQTFYNAVKAGSANAKVLGPNPVTYVSTVLPFIDSFFANGGGSYIDGISWHPYNTSNGDLAMRRRADTELLAVLTSRGQTAKPRFQTEHGELGCSFGVMYPRVQAHREMLAMVMNDQLGVPKENNHHWYLLSIGFWGYPAFHAGQDDDLFPVIGMMRTFSEELYGKTYTSAIDFGSPGNDLLCGNVYTNAGTGEKVWMLMDAGIMGQVNLSFYTTMNSVRVVDCWGNESIITPVGNRFSITAKEVPTYVRLTAGATLELDKLDWAENPLRTTEAVPTATAGATAKLAMLKNATYDNSYYAENGSVSHAEFPWYVEAPSNTEVTVPFDREWKIDTVLVVCPPPWQNLGTLLAFDVYTKDAGASTYTMRASIDRPAPLIKSFASSERTFACSLESFYDDKRIFIVPLGAEYLTGGIRLQIRDATYGGNPTLATHNRHGEPTAFSGGAWVGQVGRGASTDGKIACIQEVRAYNRGYPVASDPITKSGRKKPRVRA